jgi:hypothetical protein
MHGLVQNRNGLVGMDLAELNGSVPNRSPNRFEGWFELVSYPTDQFGELILTWASLKKSCGHCFVHFI